MLNKSLFMITTIFLLTIASATTGFSDSRGGNGNGNGNGGGSGGGNNHESIPLSQDEVDGLLYMREEEKLARDSYITLGGQWGLLIFENIAESEQSHMDAMKTLLDKYELPDPVTPGVGEYTNEHLQELYDGLMARGSQSLMDSLNVGVTIEETDIIDIQHAIDLADHEDIISTYETLVCGSRNHLRAFVRQIEANGGVYDPGEELFIEIAYSPMERRCGKKK